jgi:imidazolonepropionase-like amidohydrolase
MSEPITPDQTDPDKTPDAPDEQAETFPREYVEKLRQEAADARVRAKRADDYAQALFHARVAATGRLADPADLPFNADQLDDPDTLDAAIDTLLDTKPHLATRTPRGDIGQGITTTTNDVDLAAILRRGA